MSASTEYIDIRRHLPGVRVKELFFEVPLSRDKSDKKLSAETINIFARELRSDDPRSNTFPIIVFLQGGPGFPAPVPTCESVPAWVRRALTQYRVLLLDQRGTGLSSPIITQTVAHLTPEEQADRFACYRADSIVADLEDIRVSYGGGERWSLLGQSYGGFVITCYASRHPEALRELLFTGGIPITRPPVGAPPASEVCLADHLYRALIKRLIIRNQEYYAMYPQDVIVINAIAQYLETNNVVMPLGGRLTVRRFQMLGMGFGFIGGYEQLHQLILSAFVMIPGKPMEISYTFLRAVEAKQGFDTNPIYAILHESIYCSGGAPSRWSAQRVLKEFPEFEWTGEVTFARKPLYFTGEMVFDWMFDDFAELRPLKEASQLLAERKWPALYGEPQFAEDPADRFPLVDPSKGLPVAAAAVYYDDLYVERQFSEETANGLLRECGIDAKLWITNEFDHGGLRTDGDTIFQKLTALCRGSTMLR